MHQDQDNPSALSCAQASPSVPAAVAGILLELSAMLDGGGGGASTKAAHLQLAFKPFIVPHSWKISEWTERASGVYPGSTERARYVVRMHKSELLQCGALSRVGRDLIAIGPRWVKWLEKHACDVPGFEIAANRVTPQLEHPSQ